MIAGLQAPAATAILIAVLLLIGSTITLVGAIGLIRLNNFYQRIHAPTLGATLGTGCILIASMVFFSATNTRVVVHEVLIGVIVTVSAPVNLMMLARAAMHREHEEQDAKS